MTDLGKLVTEAVHPASAELATEDSLSLVRTLHRVDQEILPAVEAVLGDVSRAVDLVVASLHAGGCLLYVGAGTSGRLGALDAAECPPTFGVSPDRVRFAIAGGLAALTTSVEQAEDDTTAGAQAVAEQTRPGDTVIGIAASSRTPYVIGALQEACGSGRSSVLVTCNPAGAESLAEVVIRPVVGPEIIAGSTRMKAGTATKLVLNMISSAAMIRLGKVYRGRMVDLSPRCGKLVDRARRIVGELVGCDAERAQELLEKADWQAKLAVVMGALDLDSASAAELLASCDGHLTRILDADAGA